MKSLLKSLAWGMCTCIHNSQRKKRCDPKKIPIGMH
jgi:hypothetical protein